MKLTISSNYCSREAAHEPDPSHQTTLARDYSWSWPLHQTTPARDYSWSWPLHQTTPARDYSWSWPLHQTTPAKGYPWSWPWHQIATVERLLMKLTIASKYSSERLLIKLTVWKRLIKVVTVPFLLQPFCDTKTRRLTHHWNRKPITGDFIMKYLSHVLCSSSKTLVSNRFQHVIWRASSTSQWCPIHHNYGLSDSEHSLADVDKRDTLRTVRVKLS